MRRAYTFQTFPNILRQLAELAPSTTLVAGFNEVASFLLSRYDTACICFHTGVGLHSIISLVRLSIVGDELALAGVSSRLPIVDQEDDISSANSKLSKATKVSGQYCVINMSGSPTLITSSVSLWVEPAQHSFLQHSPFSLDIS